MCVTTNPAELTGTMAFTYATLLSNDPRSTHVSGYQNIAHSNGPNCMLLHFPGNNLELVDGPQHTQFFMHSLTDTLPALEYIRLMRGASLGGARVETYGKYDVVIVQDARDIIPALQQVDPSRRPAITAELEQLVDWYSYTYQGYSFVLACWNGRVATNHPVVVKYTPHNDDLLFIPGIDAHDGLLPQVGQLQKRDFKIAFAVEGHTHRDGVRYTDDIDPKTVFWAPSTVTGLYDNRSRGENYDYVVSIDELRHDLEGWELMRALHS